jgi:hypothetical protein
MRTRILASAVVGVVMALGAGTAEAHKRTIDSTVEGQHAILKPGTNEVTVVGQVSSKASRCLADRRVKIFAIFHEGPKELVDIARTSDNGYFAGHADFTNARNALMRVTRKNIGRRGHRHVCGAASDMFEEAPPPSQDGGGPGA